MAAASPAAPGGRRRSAPSIGVHGLRHSYITAALRAGVSPEVVSPRAGHHDPALTLSVYAHVRAADDADAASRAAAALTCECGWCRRSEDDHTPKLVLRGELELR